jgi:hypothetical protein
MKNLLYLTLLLFIGISCTQAPADQASAPEAAAPDSNAEYAIASPEYVDLAAEALTHIAALDFDKWGELLADDVEYYFPDGDTGTRTALIGKKAVLDWYNNWKATSGIKSMSAEAENHLPMEALKTPEMTGLAGPYVLSYFSNKMVFDNGNTAAIRMNFASHFNADKKIDRYFTYYDRTPIINAMKGVNVLGEGEE